MLSVFSNSRICLVFSPTNRAKSGSIADALQTRPSIDISNRADCTNRFFITSSALGPRRAMERSFQRRFLLMPGCALFVGVGDAQNRLLAKRLAEQLQADR